jgi:hypothetical protein
LFIVIIEEEDACCTNGFSIPQSVDNIDIWLQEAIIARIDKSQLNNSTVKGQAIGGIVNETLQRYREAHGIEEGRVL